MIYQKELSPIRLMAYGLSITIFAMFLSYLFEGDVVQLLNGKWNPATVASALGHIVFTICERFVGPVLILTGLLLAGVRVISPPVTPSKRSEG